MNNQIETTATNALVATAELIEPKDFDFDTVTISWMDATNILNMLTYESYAKLQRQLWAAGIYRRPTFDEYYTEANRYGLLESFTRDVWQSGYEFIADLFDDNEAYGTPCDEAAVTLKQIDEAIAIVSRRAR